MKKNHLKIIFLFLPAFLIFLPSINASHFTGSFADYGKDTGSDSLFNYLTIEAEVYITNKSKDYMVFGMLEDSEGNIIEYNDCRDVNKTGTQNFALNFDGIKIYRNKVDGPYKLKYIELNSISECNGWGMPPEREHYLINPYTTKAYPYNQFQRGDAAIYCENSPCIASSSLIKSRDNLNTPEPNAPNTIDGCEDGSYGNYLYSESIESIKATTLDHNFFKIGDTVKVEINVYCSDASNDRLNFVYSNNIDNVQWKVKDNKQCPSSGFKTFSTTFNLDNNLGQHAIRGIFGFNLPQSKVCGDNYYDDNDDIVIYVKECSIDNDCPPTECDNLDKCYDGTYRDYNNISNKCLSDFSCENKVCADYTNVTTDNDKDNYDIECDNDCNDNNPDINPGADELCNNGIDDDCDSYIDDEDAGCQGKYQMGLTKGWNLISLPAIENNDINEVIKIFGDDFKEIVTIKNGNWYLYDKSENSNLNELSESDGFWVKVNDNLTILVNEEAASLTSFNLTKGWNLIGYPSIEEKEVNELFQDVMGNIEIIYIYNNHFSSFNPEKPSNFVIKPGTGILLKVKNNAIWYFDGAYNKDRPLQVFDLNLADGWNLISMPLTSEKTKSELFGSSILYYFKENKWLEADGNERLNYSHGYWAKANESSIKIEGYPINSLDFDIIQGWNLINYPLAEESDISAFFQNVMNNVESIKIFEDGKWKSFNPSKPGELNSLSVLKPGNGLFIKAKDNAEWHFNGNELVAT